jgi:class 3 adenylate cyclase/tetratricopeptide (TPR) repeat protein
VTVLFADVANYTSISEKLDSEEVHQIIDGCFKLLMHEIQRYDGTVTQFTGDGVMSLFGVPRAHEDHAHRACYAALSIQHAMKDYSRKVQKEYSVDFRVRVGINSGRVTVGSIGDDIRIDYTALGDTTNLASRMESLAAPGSILASKDIYRMTRNFFTFTELGKLSIKGKAEPIEAYELIGAGEVQTRIGAAVIRGLTKFVGRERELGGLKRAFEKAKAGSGQVIGLVGEAGVGKSRLVLEFREALQDEEHLYLEGRCFHFGGSVAYLPILDILRSFFEIKEGMREYLVKRLLVKRINEIDANLHYALPPLHDLLSLTVEDKSYLKLAPKQKRERTFEGIRDLLIRANQGRPLILVVEDLHWIDNTSEEFLTYLTGWLATTHILLILLYRPEYDHPWGNRSYYGRIGLDQLPMKERGEFVESLLTGGEVSEEIRNLVLARAGGNPLFMEEMIYALVERGYIQKGIQGYVLSKKEIQVPDTLQGIIAARIDRLPENAKHTLQMASVIGRTFPFSILRTIMGAEERLKSDLFHLQKLEFIFEKKLFPELEYEFKHVLVQEVAYNSLLQRQRKRVHEQVGKAIETLYPERMEEFYEMLAYHYSRSENTEEAYKYLKLSGIKATQNSSLWEAFRFYSSALQVFGSKPAAGHDKREQIEIRLLATSPMIALGFPEGSLQILEEGEKLSKEANAAKNLATFCGIKGLYYSVRGDSVAGARYGEEYLRMAEEAQDIELMAPIAFDLCFNYAHRGEFSKVTEIAPKIVSLLEQTKREFESFDRGYNIYSAILGFYGYCAAYLGDFEKGEVLCRKGLDVATTIKNFYSLGLVELLYGIVYISRFNGKEAMEHFLKSIQYFEKGQILVYQGIAWSLLGVAHYFMGEFQNARRLIEKGLQIHLEAGISYDLSAHYWYLGTVHYDLNELHRARECIEEAIRLAQKNNETYVLGGSLIVLGRILAKSGNSQLRKAEDSILQGIRILETLKEKNYCAAGYFCLGGLYAGEDQREKAVEALKRAERIFSETGTEAWVTKAQTTLKGLT